MTLKKEDITVEIKYQNVLKTFSGPVEHVWLALNTFFTEFIPTFEISRRMILNVNLENLIKQCEGIIAFAEKDSLILIHRNSLTDNETLALQLLASYVGHNLGFMLDENLSREELMAALGKSSKITSTRLGELIRSGIVDKTDDNKYRITTFGVVHMQKNVLPKIVKK